MKMKGNLIPKNTHIIIKLQSLLQNTYREWKEGREISF